MKINMNLYTTRACFFSFSIFFHYSASHVGLTPSIITYDNLFNPVLIIIFTVIINFIVCNIQFGSIRVGEVT